LGRSATAQKNNKIKIFQFKERIATGLRVERAGVQIPAGKQIFLISKTQKNLFWGPNHRLIQWESGLFPVVKVTGVRS
jgi:hypothetical protein